ncbi:hypothetical protein R84B8_01790 [Treponema sp. R8-4-B8]
MNIMIINGSPKKKGGASSFFGNVLRCMLFPNNVTIKSIGISIDYDKIFDNLQNIDAVVISVPLYIDSIPSHFIHFLKQMEQYCKNNKCRFMLYVISNSGFVEGHQNHAHLEQYKCWCERADITWGGGLGIGGGVMLNVLYKIMLLWTGIQISVRIIINIFSGNSVINNAFNTLLSGLINSAIIILFFYCGVLLFEFMLSWAIENKMCMKNKYTRVTLPSFIFIAVADIFMTLKALFNGKLIFSLFKKEEYTKIYKGNLKWITWN